MNQYIVASDIYEEGGMIEGSQYLMQIRMLTDGDPVEAVKAACKEYCQTEDGKRIYKGNCHSFNWGDFWSYVPDSICANHGFVKIDHDSDVISVNFNEQLVIEHDICPEE